MEISTIRDFADKKYGVIKCLQDTLPLIESIDSLLEGKNSGHVSEPSFQTIITNLIEKVQNDVFKVLVVGEFSTGKSTFLNALLGEDVLPMAVKPTTATINLIKYSDNKNIKVHFFGDRNDNGKEISIGKTIDIPWDQLKEYSTSLTIESDDRSKEIKLVEVFMPSDYCINGVEVLDTPGLNSVNGYHEKATLDYLPNGNAGIMIFSAAQFLTGSESNYLKTFKKYMDKVFFIANKVDFLTPEELEEHLPFWESQIKDVLKSEEEVKIYPLIAKKAMDGTDNSSGFDEFIKVFESFITSDSKAIAMINPPVNTVTDILKTYKSNINILRKGMQFSPEEFENKMALYKPKLDRIKRRRNEILDYISTSELHLNNTLDFEFAKFKENYLKYLTSEIINWEGETKELKTKLPQIIKETLADYSGKLQDNMSQKLLDIFRETNSKYRDFVDDLDDLQVDMISQSKNTQENLIDLSEIHDNDFGLGGYALVYGSALGIGWIGASILLGPLAWIVATGGSYLIGFFYAEKKRKKNLQKMAEIVREKLEKEISPSLPSIKLKTKELISEFKNKIGNQMNALLQSVENTVNEIKMNMDLEKEKVEQKTIMYEGLYKELVVQEEMLNNLKIN